MYLRVRKDRDLGSQLRTGTTHLRGPGELSSALSTSACFLPPSQTLHANSSPKSHHRADILRKSSWSRWPTKHFYNGTHKTCWKQPLSCPFTLWTTSFLLIYRVTTKLKENQQTGTDKALGCPRQQTGLVYTSNIYHRDACGCSEALLLGSPTASSNPNPTFLLLKLQHNILSINNSSEVPKEWFFSCRK